MEIAIALRSLWRRKFLVVLAALLAAGAGLLTGYDVSISPFAVKKKSLQFGAASTQIVVDAPISAIGNLSRDISPLANRAQIMTEFMQSESVRDAIGRRLGVPGGAIAIEADAAVSQTRAAREPDATRRGNQLLYEGVGYRLSVNALPELPIISVAAQAPTPAAAVRLADGAIAALRSYLPTLQQRVRPSQRTVVRQLGVARGGVVNQGASLTTAIVTAIVVFAVLCLLILLAGGLAREWRRLAQRERQHAIAPFQPGRDVPIDSAGDEAHVEDRREFTGDRR